MEMCSSRIPTPRKVIGNSSGEKVLQVKILETKYEVKLEFPGETKPFVGGVQIFSGTAQWKFCANGTAVHVPLMIVHLNQKVSSINLYIPFSTSLEILA